MAARAGIVPGHPTTVCRAPPQAPGCPVPSLAAFCPWDGALLVCAGLGVHREVIFYSLRHKQVRTAPPPCGDRGRGPRAGEGEVLGP